MNGIILFDGACNFCDRSVQFIIKRDPAGYYKFASLQSAAGQKTLIVLFPFNRSATNKGLFLCHDCKKQVSMVWKKRQLYVSVS